jgi:hypothetical protein
MFYVTIVSRLGAQMTQARHDTGTAWQNYRIPEAVLTGRPSVRTPYSSELQHLAVCASAFTSVLWYWGYVL